MGYLLWLLCGAQLRLRGEARKGKIAKEKSKGSWTAKGLKRRLIRASVTPALALSSVVADIDVVTDWYFFQSASIQESGYRGIITAALFYCVLGTFAWLLLAVDGVGWLSATVCGGPCCRRVVRRWSLISTILEDLPQLVLTVLTNGFRTLPGALNITASVFSFLAINWRRHTLAAGTICQRTSWV